MRAPYASTKKREYSTLAQSTLTIGNGNGWIVVHTLSPQPTAPAEIYVFEEEKETMVKPAEVFKEGSPHEYTTPRHPIGIALLIGADVGLEIALHTMGKEPSENGAIGNHVYG